MGTALRLVSLFTLLGLTGCQAYADVARSVARAVNPDVRAAEARLYQHRQQAPPQECLCAPVPVKSPR